MLTNLIKSKEILSEIRDLVDFGATSFESLDDIDQDKLTALAISACDGDLDIVLSHQALLKISIYFQTYERDDEIEMTRSIQQCSREYFSESFNQLIQEEIDNRFQDNLYASGKSMAIDKVNGEAYWY
jgi:hypothetical protein